MPRFLAGDRTEGIGCIRPPSELMQPDSLSLDRSLGSVGGRALKGAEPAALTRLARLLWILASGRTGAFLTTSGASAFELGRPTDARRFPLQVGMTEFTNPTGSRGGS
jgi:hypothetical protein